MDINWKNLSHEELVNVVKNLDDRIERIAIRLARLLPYGKLGLD